MPSNDSSLEEIKSRIDIVEMISEYVSLKKAGHNWKGLCPFHSEKTPSFMVNPSRQIYKCFGCGSGGDIFSFVMQHENLGFREALVLLAKKAGVTLKDTGIGAGAAGEKEELFNITRQALDFFRQSLTKSLKAADYLRKRGVGEDAQNFFSLGYAPRSWDALKNHLEGKGFRTEALLKAGLIVRGDKGLYDKFRDRVIFPIFNLQGEAVAFGGRVMDSSEPKYLNSPETPLFNKSRMLYGLNNAKKHIKDAGSALLMEGYLDVITAYTNGFKNAVAPLGTAFTQEQGKLIKRFTDNAILFFDRDEAGVKAAKNATGILVGCGLNVMLSSLPEGEDPDSFIRRQGSEAFNKLLGNPLTLIDFLLQQKKQRHQIIGDAVEIISKADDLSQAVHVRRLSEKLKLEERHIYEEIGKIRQKANREAGRAEKSPELVLSRKKPKPLDEMYIIKLLLQFPDKSGEIFASIKEDDFQDPAARSVLKKIRGGLTDFDKLILQCEEGEKWLLSDVIFKNDFEDPDKVLKDCLRCIKEKKHKLQLQELRDRIRDAELRKDDELLKKLLMRQDSLQKTAGR
ncbi:MAG: DNA primase [Nitrospirae bacterium]|nr:DNA primase [Nitrospirota bacterium]